MKLKNEKQEDRKGRAGRPPAAQVAAVELCHQLTRELGRAPFGGEVRRALEEYTVDPGAALHRAHARGWLEREGAAPSFAYRISAAGEYLLVEEVEPDPL